MPNELDPEIPTELICEPRFSAGSSVLIGAGILLIFSGLLHVPVWTLDGSDWEGRVSWRKPILFGVSTGMTLWSLGWIASALKHRRFANLDRAVSFAIAVSLVIEVALITLQQWRGTASHFNQETEFDGWIDFAMLGLICIAFLGIVYFGIRSLGTLQLNDEYALSARWGMLFLILSCIIGFVISAHGYTRTEAELPPETFGENGVAKFPHGVTIHVLQILPGIVFLLKRLNFRPEIRKQFVWYVSGSFLTLLIFACVQTVAGQARFEMNSWVSCLLLFIATAIMLVPVIRVAFSIALHRSFVHVLEQPKVTER